MLTAGKENFVEAEKQNPWFRLEFIKLMKGDALHLPVKDNSIDVAAQNYLFNMFKHDDLKKALQEMYCVLKPHGRLVLSDPICEQEMPSIVTTCQTKCGRHVCCLKYCLPFFVKVTYPEVFH